MSRFYQLGPAQFRLVYDHVDFLQHTTEFTAMVNKAQWLVLSYDAITTQAPSQSSYQSKQQ
jgi:hypothetical protein